MSNHHIQTKQISLADPISILSKDLSLAHKKLSSASTFPTTATRSFSISLQFDAPSSADLLVSMLPSTTSANLEDQQPKQQQQPGGIPCRFKSIIELGPVEELAAAPVRAWKIRRTKIMWTAEEDLAVVKASSLEAACEGYRAARSAFPGTLAEADVAFPKPIDTDEDKNVFADRWTALNTKPELYERKRLLSSLQQSRAFADDTQVKNDDDILERIQTTTIHFDNNNYDNHHHQQQQHDEENKNNGPLVSAALTSTSNNQNALRGAASSLQKAVTRKLAKIRAITNNNTDGIPFDVEGMHGHAPPNTALIGAMTPDLIVVAKSAPPISAAAASSLLLKQQQKLKLQQLQKEKTGNNNKIAEVKKNEQVGEDGRDGRDADDDDDDEEVDRKLKEKNGENNNDSNITSAAATTIPDTDAIVATLKCTSSSVLPASNMMKQIASILLAQQKSDEDARRAKRAREREEKENAAIIEGAKTGRTMEAVLAEWADNQRKERLAEAAAAAAGGSAEIGADVGAPVSVVVVDDSNSEIDEEENGNNASKSKKYPPITLSEYDDQFGFSPGRDSFGVFSNDNLQRFFNFCEDINAVDLCTEAEAEYIAVREAVQRHSVRSSEAKILQDRKAALKDLANAQQKAELGLRDSFQKTFDDVVSSLANVFESHMATAIQALRDKVSEEKERVEALYDMEEHATLLSRYKLGLAAFCPDSIANRKSFHGLEGRRGLILGDYQKWGTSTSTTISAIEDSSNANNKNNTSSLLFQGMEQEKNNNKNDTSSSSSSSACQDPLEIITKLLLLTETLQCPQLSQTLVQEIALSSKHFVEFYNRREFHEFPLLSRDTIKALLTAVPLSELIQAKQIENDAKSELLDKLDADADADYKNRVEAANRAKSSIPVERYPPPPPPLPSVLSKLADEELAFRRRTRQEQLEQMSTNELADLLRKCKVTEARLRRKFRQQVRNQKQHLFDHHHGRNENNNSVANGGRRISSAGKKTAGVASAKRGNSNKPSTSSSSSSANPALVLASIPSKEQRQKLVPAIMSIKRKSIITGLLEEEDDDEFDDELLQSIELARDVNAGHIDKLGDELTSDSDAEEEEKGVDVLVSRLLNSSNSRQADNARLRVAITQNVNKLKMKRKRHVEDSTHYIGLIEEVLQKRLFSTAGTVTIGGGDSSSNSKENKSLALPALKSSSLLLLTSSFKRGNRWRIHNKVSAHDTAVAITESGTNTILSALQPLKPYTFFAMFPNESTLRRRCGTSTGKVFFQVRILSGPGSANQTRLIGVGFDTSAHSRKVPMLNYDPLEQLQQQGQQQQQQSTNLPNNKRLDKNNSSKINNNNNNNSNNSTNNAKAQVKNNRIVKPQFDPNGHRILEPVGEFSQRWGLTSSNEDMCLSILNKLKKLSKTSLTNNTNSNNNNNKKNYLTNRKYNVDLTINNDEENDFDEDENTLNNNNSASFDQLVFYEENPLLLERTSSSTSNKPFSNAATTTATSSAFTNNSKAQFMSDLTYIPGSTAAPHPAESSLAAELRRAAITNRKRINRGGFENEMTSSIITSDFNDPLSSPFDTYEDETRVAPTRANHGFLWLSNGTILLHGSTYALGREGIFVAGDTLHIALDEAEGSVRLFRNGQQIPSPVFIPCPPVDLLTRYSATSLSAVGSAKANNVANLFAPQLPQQHEVKPVLERAFWGIGPLIPCVTLVDAAPEHSVEGRPGKVGYLTNELFSLHHRTFKKAMAMAAEANAVNVDGNSAVGKITASSKDEEAGHHEVDETIVSELDLSRFSLPSVECNVEGPFEEEGPEQLPDFLIKGNYVPFLKAQREL